MELTIRTNQGSYPIYINADEFSFMTGYFQKAQIGSENPIVLVTDHNVLTAGYPQKIQAALTNAGYQVDILDVAPGDKSKSLQTCESLFNRLLDLGIRRNGVIVAVGGGVIGDLAGFVAATYERGIRFVQCPTTLLAHDSSIGGKVGINLSRGKNLVGAFYPPKFVLYHVTTLASLPVREWRNGMAEVIKHGMIGNAGLLAQLDSKPIRSCPPAADAVALLAEAMKVKVRIVEEDEHESGLRMVLNLGHTIGHAVEQLSGYQIHHGEAVSIGICIEAKISVFRGYLEEYEAKWIEDLLIRHGLPTQLPDYSIDDIFTKIQIDKKHRGKTWTFALPKGIGNAVIVHDVTHSEVQAACERP